MELFYKQKNCDPKCIYPVQSMTVASSASFPKKCKTVCTEIRIQGDCDMTAKQLSSLFKNMKVLIGSITVLNSNLTNVNFLSGLESIECFSYRLRFGYNSQLLELGLTNLTSASCFFIVYNNNNMRKLNMPNLKTITPPDLSLMESIDYRNRTYIDISPNSPDFCITTEEMKLFMTTDTSYIEKLYGKFCEPVFTDKLCKAPEPGCLEVFGDVEINSEFKTETMRTVEGIYGSLVINGTNLTDFSFLENLKYVVTLEQKLAITIENNANLINVMFPKLKKIYSNTTDPITFKNNNKLLLRDPSHCFGIRSSLSLIDWAPTFDDLTCEEIGKNAPKIQENEQNCGSSFLGKYSYYYHYCLILLVYF